MSIVFITGNHPRHFHFAETLAQAGLLSGLVIEERTAFVPTPPVGLSSSLQELFSRHFRLREEAEAEIFQDQSKITGEVPTCFVTKESLNELDTIKFVQSCHPKIVLSYGCNKIGRGFMEQVEATFWNSHGGLSPQYRGTITHFWPSYFLEPQMTGVTLHETSNHIDGGGIIHQTGAVMVAGDGLHQLAGRTVKNYTQDLVCQLKKLDLDKPLPQGIKQKGYGKVFLNSDWRPEHLPWIYETHQDRIVDLALSGAITGKQPNLISVL